MGKPGWGNAQSLPDEFIVRREGTPGTETSKYRKEEKETSIPKVAASEMGRAQTRFIWGCGPPKEQVQYSRRRLESRTTGGKSPVHEMHV